MCDAQCLAGWLWGHKNLYVVFFSHSVKKKNNNPNPYSLLSSGFDKINGYGQLTSRGYQQADVLNTGLQGV